MSISHPHWKLLILAAGTVATAARISAAGAPILPTAVCELPHMLQIDGLERTESSPLLRYSQRGEGGGGLCSAVAYEVTKPVTVYRLTAWSPDKMPDYYNWWSFENPSGSGDVYRKENVMCKEWGVEMKTTCKLRVGTKIAVGFGQSYGNCIGDKWIGPSKTLQVYLVGDRNDVQKQVEDCKVEPGLLQP